MEEDEEDKDEEEERKKSKKKWRRKRKTKSRRRKKKRRKTKKKRRRKRGMRKARKRRRRKKKRRRRKRKTKRRRRNTKKKRKKKKRRRKTKKKRRRRKTKKKRRSLINVSNMCIYGTSRVRPAGRQAVLCGKKNERWTLRAMFNTKLVSYLACLQAPLTDHFYTTFSDLDLSWGSQSQRKAKPVGFIFSHTFQLIWMKSDIVSKQFKLTSATKGFSQIC